MSGRCERPAGPRKGVVLATMFMLFSMIQFLLNFAGSMGVVIQNQFGVSNALAQLGPSALFLAFLFMGLPGGMVLKRRGYRFTAMLATGFAFAALGVQLVSRVYHGLQLFALTFPRRKIIGIEVYIYYVPALVR